MSTVTMSPMNLGGWKVVAVVLGLTAAVILAWLGVGAVYWYESQSREVIIPVKTESLPTPLFSPKALLGNWTLPMLPTASGAGTGASPNAWDDLNDLHQRMDQLFNDAMSQFPVDPSVIAMTSPNLDIREDRDHYTVRVDLPGADKSSLNVTVDDGRILRVSADRKTDRETTDVNHEEKIIQSERSLSHFERSVELPGSVNITGINAKYDNGVLTITLPKAPSTPSTTKVEVH